jgi:Myb/SANT-like DNA-binding domain
LDEIGFTKKYKNKLKLFGFIAKQLNLKYGTDRTARNVADKIKNTRQSQKLKNSTGVKVKKAPKQLDVVYQARATATDADVEEEEWLEEELPVMSELVIERMTEAENCESSGQSKNVRWDENELDALRRIYNANIHNVGYAKQFRTKTKLYDHISEQMRIKLGSNKTQQNIAGKIKNINYYYRVKKPSEPNAVFPGKLEG